ncbi:MAG: hypothetical protein H3C34_28505 [Caldilineaceae bacterium]|nr:hypothetical protein [Caldilineaceae bacterium]
MEISSLAKKLQIKPGQTVLVINGPVGYTDLLKPLPAGAVLVTDKASPCDVVHLFATDSRDLHRYAGPAVAALKTDGTLWVSFPKGSSGIKTDLSRDAGWEVLADAGWEAVRLVAVDDTWSAVRFRQGVGRDTIDLLEQQFGGAKATLRPIYDRVAATMKTLGDDIEVGIRTTYVAFSRRQQFAVCKAKMRPLQLELGLRLVDRPATARLESVPRNFGASSATHVVVLRQPEDVDDAVRGWLRAAYDQA